MVLIGSSVTSEGGHSGRHPKLSEHQTRCLSAPIARRSWRIRHDRTSKCRRARSPMRYNASVSPICTLAASASAHGPLAAPAGCRLGKARQFRIHCLDPPCDSSRNQFDRYGRRIRHFEAIIQAGIDRHPGQRTAFCLYEMRDPLDEADVGCPKRSAPRPASARRPRPLCAELGVQRIDLYQMHWPPDDGTPLEAYWQTLSI